MILINEKFLQHFGVPGMKWGQRKKYGMTKREVRRKSRSNTDNQRSIRKTYTKALFEASNKVGTKSTRDMLDSNTNIPDSKYDKMFNDYQKKNNTRPT